MCKSKTTLQTRYTLGMIRSPSLVEPHPNCFYLRGGRLDSLEPGDHHSPHIVGGMVRTLAKRSETRHDHYHFRPSLLRPTSSMEHCSANPEHTPWPRKMIPSRSSDLTEFAEYFYDWLTIACCSTHNERPTRQGAGTME